MNKTLFAILLMLFGVALASPFFILMKTSKVIYLDDKMTECRNLGADYTAYCYSFSSGCTIKCESPQKDIFNIKIK